MSDTTFHLKPRRPLAENLLKVFDFETKYQVDRLANCLKKLYNKEVILTIKPVSRPKSRQALGMYWGAIVPACLLDQLELDYDPKKVYEDYRHYLDTGKCSKGQLEAIDAMLRLEFHYQYTKTIHGKPYRIPAPLATEDNGTLLDFIDKVIHWRDQQGYPELDAEAYKEKRDTTGWIGE